MSTSSSSSPTYNDTLDLRRFFRSVKRLKWVYLASFLLFMALASIYCIIKYPQYEVKATMLIEDSGSDGGLAGAGSMATMMKTFSVGGFGASSVNNEIQLVTSHDVMMSTAKALGLNRNYILRDGLSKEMLFLDSPIAVEAPSEMMDTLTKAMKIIVEIDGQKADVAIKRGFLGRVLAERKGVSLPVTLSTPFGPVSVMKTAHYTGLPQTIEVTLGSYEGAADYLLTEIDIDTPDKLADAMAFSLLYPNKQRGIAIINTLMAQYNAKRLDRKHATAKAQIDFLNDRIAAVYADVLKNEDELKKFKDKKHTPNLYAELPVLIESSATARSEMVKSTAEAAYYREILATLASNSRKDELLPVFDSDAYPMVKDYNEMLMQKKELERSAKEGNPTLTQAEANLADMRSSITRNVESMLRGAEALLASQRSLMSQADSKLSEFPASELEYASVVRNRELTNQLYAYLTSERENAFLQLYNQDTPGFIIDEAYTAIKPSRRKALLAIIACLFMAIACPTALALWLTLRSRKVVNAMDTASAGIESTTIETDGSKESVNHLRTLIMERPNIRQIYVSGNSRDEMTTSLANSLSAIGVDSIIAQPTGIGAPDDNDSLLLPAFQASLASTQGSYGETITLIPVPNPERATELSALFINGNAILLMAYSSGTLPIATLKQTVRAIGPDNIMMAIFHSPRHNK
ncbi:MAG: Wzz/FepE/Etk N-terminal domain-containing protein [Pseudoflavonifractor sp.]|nr:Wzz/FepE/Etk N-terminal domain-containing protein [Alloprevotella sp.]MCM1116122.1 Wzz/FepE/Etk N-terminal domain-containing protein [Pseudoflavonifractor sp.]